MIIKATKKLQIFKCFRTLKQTETDKQTNNSNKKQVTVFSFGEPKFQVKALHKRKGLLLRFHFYSFWFIAFAEFCWEVVAVIGVPKNLMFPYGFFLFQTHAYVAIYKAHFPYQKVNA